MTEPWAATQEAVTLYRRLAGQRPDAFTPDLAASLVGLGVRFTESDRPEGARRADQEAVELYRVLSLRWPTVFSQRLAQATQNYAIDLRDLGRSEAEIDTAMRAILDLSSLARADPPEKPTNQ